MREMVKIAKALADESRIRMLKLLLERDICVREMQEIMGISQPQVSRNMKILMDAGFLRRWQKHLVSHPLVVSFSLRPHPWLNSDGTLDFHRMCIRVVLGRKLSDEEMERYNLPRLIEGYPVQYRHPGMFPPRKPFALPGDSGSLCFLRDGTPVGLVFAILGGGHLHLPS